MAKINNKLVETGLQRHNGNISLVAKNLGVTRQSIYDRINKNPKLQQVWSETRERAIDNAESALQRSVDNGEAWAVCFTLKTIGRKRGYVEKQEIEHSGGVTVHFDKEDEGVL